jgi:hypothetical protein
MESSEKQAAKSAATIRLESQAMASESAERKRALLVLTKDYARTACQIEHCVVLQLAAPESSFHGVCNLV